MRPQWEEVGTASSPEALFEFIPEDMFDEHMLEALMWFWHDVDEKLNRY